jgi:hypothetical protein
MKADELVKALERLCPHPQHLPATDRGAVYQLANIERELQTLIARLEAEPEPKDDTCPTCDAYPVRVVYDSCGNQYLHHEHPPGAEPEVLAEGDLCPSENPNYIWIWLGPHREGMPRARIIAEGKPKVLAEGMGAEYGHTGVWMVWGGEMGQLPWVKDTAVQARRVAIIALEENRDE